MERITIIGAGIAGASAAYELSKRGFEVTVFDRNEPASATQAAAGIICPWLSQRRNQDWYQLVRHGARHYHTLIPELIALGETETGYRQVGAISLFADDKKLDKAMERAHARKELAPEIGDIQKLNEEETRALYPFIAEGYQSVYISGAARVEGQKLCDALIRSAKKYGAKFVNGHAELCETEAGVIHVCCDHTRYECDKILFATGAWAPQLKNINAQFNVRGQKAQIVHMDPHHEKSEEWPVVIPPGDQYLLSFDDGRVVAGATHEDEDVFHAVATAGGVQEVLTKALTTAPGLVDAELLEIRTGVRPFTAGFLPVIGALPNHPSMYAINGLGASGLTAGPFLGKLLAQLCAGEPLDIDLTPYMLEQVVESIT